MTPEERASGVNNQAWDILSERTIRILALHIREAEKEAVERFKTETRTITEYDSRPCPLCRYQEGVFIEACANHKEIDRLRAENEKLKKVLHKVHACATMQEDGSCNGCPISEALGE